MTSPKSRSEWRRLTATQMAILADELRATPADKAGAILRFWRSHATADKIIDDTMVGVIAEYLYADRFKGKLIRQNLKKELKSLSATHWAGLIDLIHLHTICCYFGLISLGCVFRQKARAALVNIYRSSSHRDHDAEFLKLVIACGLEISDLDLVRQAADDLVRDDKTHPSLAALVGIGVIPPIDAATTKNPEDQRYADFLQNEHVAIVGPAVTPPGSPQSDLGDHGVVVTMNARDAAPRAHMPPTARFVSYYNGEQARYIINNELPAPSYLKWTVLKKRGHKKSFDALGARSSRIMKSCGYLMFNGIPNALQNVLYDLATFQTRSTKVFQCDFMLSAGREKGYFPSEWKRDTDARMRSGARKAFALKHDPISQFLFAKTIIALKATEADEVLSDVLAMNEATFALSLEKVYRLRPSK